MIRNLRGLTSPSLRGIYSFRIRIALLSVVCSCLALAGSAILTWRIGWNVTLQQIDRQIRSIIQDELYRLEGPPEFHNRPTDNRNMPPPPWDDFPGGPSPEGPDEPLFSPSDAPGGSAPDHPPPPPGSQKRQTLFTPSLSGTNDRPTSSAQQLSQPDRFQAPTVFTLRFNHSGHLLKNSDPLPIPVELDEWVSFAQKTASPRGQSSSPPPSSGRNRNFPPSKRSVRYTTFRTIESGGREWRLGAGRQGRFTIALGVDISSFKKDNWRMVGAFLLTVPAALILIALGAIFISGRALRPVRELTLLAERVTACGLDERIETQTHDPDFDRLTQVFNQMLDRLERSFKQATRFSADAAHELRTPLTILQGHLERIVQENQPGSPNQARFEKLLEEIHRIKSILERLLLLARIDAGQITLHLVPTHLSEIVNNVVEDIEALAPEITVSSHVEPDIWISADPPLIETAIQNLANNAVKYNLDRNGRISIELAIVQDRVRLIMSNTGPAISESDRGKIFERFYRIDKSRSREIDGTGLGLSLAREIVQVHQGSLDIIDSPDGINRFQILLPILYNRA